MAQISTPPQSNEPKSLRINGGTRPDWQTRINYPQLFNMFVGESGHVYTNPGLSPFNTRAPITNGDIRAIHFSAYMSGSYFVVTRTKIIQIFSSGSFTIIANIENSGDSVQIDENTQNQVIIVDGRHGYVYAQRATPPTFTELTSTQGFEITQPISVCVLNDIAVVLDLASSTFILSDPNNFLSWPALDFASIDSNLTKAVGLETMNNNLFVFGTTGIERWVPQTGNNPYIFPFMKDVSFRQDFGAIATNGIMRGFNEIYFLSSKFVPMVLNPQGLFELGDADYKAGLAKILASYSDVTECEGSFYTFKGNYFFSMTFKDTGISWIYCTNSKTFSTSDDLIISALNTYQVVATPSGMFNLVNEPQEKKHRMWIGDNMRLYKSQQPTRQLMNGFDVQMIQGAQHQGKEELELSFSLDGQKTWTNIVNRPIGRTAERNAQTTWSFNIAAKEAVPRVSYYGILEFTIYAIYMLIN